MRNPHAGIIRWLNDRRRAELRAEVSAKGFAQKRAHKILALQIAAAVKDLERMGEERVADREGRDSDGPRARVEHREDSEQTKEEDSWDRGQ